MSMCAVKSPTYTPCTTAVFTPEPATQPALHSVGTSQYASQPSYRASSPPSTHCRSSRALEPHSTVYTALAFRGGMLHIYMPNKAVEKNATVSASTNNPRNTQRLCLSLSKAMSHVDRGHSAGSWPRVWWASMCCGVHGSCCWGLIIPIHIAPDGAALRSLNACDGTCVGTYRPSGGSLLVLLFRFVAAGSANRWRLRMSPGAGDWVQVYLRRGSSGWWEMYG